MQITSEPQLSMTPQECARIEIDRQLSLTGWRVQDYASRSNGTALGIVISLQLIALI